jgi:hypothetical protein
LRKFAAILLLVILLFNWVGYRLLTNVLQHSANIRLEAKLDKNDYKEEDLIEIKVPVDLPYQLNWNSFERFDGEIDVDGIHYKYVKRKIYNDSLVLLCLPNQTKQNLEKAKEDYFKGVNDIDQSSQKKSDNNLTFKNILSEFFVEQPSCLNKPCVVLNTSYCTGVTQFISSILPDTQGQPPEC